MRFTVNRDDLLKPLQFVSGVVERKQTHAILGNVLLVLDKGELSFTCSDSELEVIARIKLDGDFEEGEITVPAKKLTDICKSLPSAMIDASVHEGKFILKSGRSRFNLTTLPANEFPNVEEKAGLVNFSIPRNVLCRLLDQTAFAMAVQDVRYYLNGMLMEISDGRLVVVATDGHRLALSGIDIALPIETPSQVIIPRKGVMEMTRIFSDGTDEVAVSISSNHIRVYTDDICFTSKLVDGRYPDYKRVIPADGEVQFVVNREEIKLALQRAAILSNEKYRGVRLFLSPNSILINTNNPEQEAAEEQVFVDYSGKEIELGFNVNYLLDVLNILKSEDVHFSIADGNHTSIIKNPESDEAIYIVMPMKM
ncbi:MAG: DNA polymerase III subunit beta [Pseudomonadales bacterium]|nr:DNA polymerase III subunit beta [Pseudomonadales bacterium]